MFEMFSTWWVRVYPRSFQERYGDEMLFLIRNRIREEKGAFSTVRLGLELAFDLAVSLPRVYLNGRSGFITEANGGLLTFRLVDQKKPSYKIFIVSTILSVVLLHSIRDLHPCAGMAAAHHQAGYIRLHVLIRQATGFFAQ